MTDLELFVSENEPLRGSKLSEFDDDILELLNNGYVPKQIHEYITVYRKKSITQRRLYQYIKELKASVMNKKTLVKVEDETN